MANKIPEKTVFPIHAAPSGHSPSKVAAGRPTDINSRIKQRAYELFSARNSQAGHDLEDWLQAEKEIKCA